MTRAEKILNLLRERPRTFEELQELSGAPSEIVRNTLSDLKRSGYTESVPTTYRVTEKAEAEEGKPKIEWKEIKARQASAKQMQPKLGRARSASEGIVASAMRNVPSSVFNLGGMQA